MKASETQVSAEIIPISGEATRAPRSPQEAGFKVFHVGETISVQGPSVLFERTFNVSFQLVERGTQLPSGSGDFGYLKAETAQLRIAVQLVNTVKDLYFVEPPEWF